MFFIFIIKKSVLCYSRGKSRALTYDTLDFLVMGSFRTSWWDFSTPSSRDSLLVSCTVLYLILIPEAAACVQRRAHLFRGFNSTFKDWPNICGSCAQHMTFDTMVILFSLWVFFIHQHKHVIIILFGVINIVRFVVRHIVSNNKGGPFFFSYLTCD